MYILIRPFSLGNYLGTPLNIRNLNNNQGDQCRMDMVRVRASGILPNMLSCTWVIQYHRYLVHSLAFLQSPIQSSTFSNSVLQYSKLVLLKSHFSICLAYVPSPKHSLKFLQFSFFIPISIRFSRSSTWHCGVVFDACKSSLTSFLWYWNSGCNLDLMCYSI